MNTSTIPIMDALGWTLLHAVWQGFALVLPVAIVLHFLRNRSSAGRYRVGVAGLLAQVLVSVGTFGWLYQPAVAVSAMTTLPGAAVQTLPVRWQVIAQTLPWYVQMQQFLAAHLGEFVLIYLIGVAVFALRLAGGWLYLQRIGQTATRPASERFVTLVASLQRLMQVRAVVRVRESARVAVPMVVGALKPILLLPVGLVTNLSMAEVEAILAHELAHVKRHDYAVNLLQSVVEVLYFFHPALWWLSARVREEREHCCDDLAVQTIGGDGRTLAQALAHIEELRQTQLSTPALAMALTSKRQLLLHRVRRMLGVSTRPLVSNSSLAGLTLATLLLVSASVYAVQQQPAKQPKSRVSQPKPTRRHKVGSSTEFGVSDNKKLDYVVWKGRKLPASRVANLQNLYDQVMTGQLNLDIVKQPDRDILLQLIEVNAGGIGMKALSEGFSHIDYGNIMASAQNNVPLSPDGTVEGLARVNYDSIIHSATATVSADTSRLNTAQRQLEALTKKMQEIMSERQPVIDQLSKEITELTLKNNERQKMTEQLAKQQSALAKQQSALAKQQNRLAQKLAPLHTEIARLSLQKTMQADQLIKQKQLQSDLIEKQMDQLGERMGELGSRMGEFGLQMQPQQQRVNMLADSISNLIEPISELSGKIGELSNQIAEEANEQAEVAMKQAEAAMRLVENTTITNVTPLARPARAPRPPKPPLPRLAPVAPAPAVESVPAPRPAAAPKPAPTPRPASKP